MELTTQKTINQMAQKERLLKRLLNAMEEGDRIHTKDLTLAGKKIEYLTRWQDGRLVAVYANPNYNPNPLPGKKKEPEQYAFYLDELTTVKVAELLRDIIPQVERMKQEAQAQQPTQNQ